MKPSKSIAESLRAPRPPMYTLFSTSFLERFLEHVPFRERAKTGLSVFPHENEDLLMYQGLISGYSQIPDYVRTAPRTEITASESVTLTRLMTLEEGFANCDARIREQYTS